MCVPTCLQTPDPGMHSVPVLSRYLPACLPACMSCLVPRHRFAQAESQTRQLVGAYVLQRTRNPSDIPRCRGSHPLARSLWGGRRGGLKALNLGLSRPMGQMRLCVDCAVIRERVGTHSHAAATTDITSSPLRTYLGAPRRICAFGHCHRRLHCTWGFVAVCGL